MAKALINGKTLRWARERAGLDGAEVAARLKQPVERVAAWEGEGDEKPTFKQAQKLATVLSVPFGFLFLSTPPADDLPIPDLRTVGGVVTEVLDVNARDLLRDVTFKHDWFREVLEAQGAAQLPFVGKFEIASPADDVAADIRATVGFAGAAAQSPNWETFLRRLMMQAEAAGIWVMRSGIVGSNTHRTLSMRQFRGFAISDRIVPLVFINGNDAQAAQIFTLAHELAHIWLGTSGISNIAMGQRDFGVTRRIEIACNKIAAQALVPAAELNERWNEEQTAAENYERLHRHFKVSRVVIARRALDLGKVAEAAYARYYRQEEETWEAEKAEGGGGGDFYKTLPVRNGYRFTNAVVSRAVSGQTLLRDAAALLNTTPTSVRNFHRVALAG